MPTPDIALLTEKQTCEVLRDCIDNLTDEKVITVLLDALTPDMLAELAGRSEAADTDR